MSQRAKKLVSFLSLDPNLKATRTSLIGSFGWNRRPLGPVGLLTCPSNMSEEASHPQPTILRLKGR